MMGTFGSVPATLGGGTVADIMAPMERGKAVGLWSLGPTLVSQGLLLLRQESQLLFDCQNNTLTTHVHRVQ